jgi:DNA repair protein RecN (Recombination protein N)
MTGSGGRESAGELVSRAIRELSGLERFDPEIDGLRSQLEQVESLLYDFNRELSDYEESLTFDESVFRETEDRLDLISRLESKYGDTIAKVLAHRDACEETFEKYDNFEQYLANLENRFVKAEKELLQIAREVSDIRGKYSRILGRRIEEALEDLGFLGVQFVISCEKKDHCSANGIDQVRFLISTNPGEEVRPLARVASGGELSRIMLAIKSVMADSDAIETLIFDEIDAGISGRTAQKVSEKLALLSGSHQIICITHLPQIASMADEHFVIEKESDGSRTRTQIRRLAEEEEVSELARLLGGAKITETVLESAGEMKKLAQQRKAELSSFIHDT